MVFLLLLVVTLLAASTVPAQASEAPEQPEFVGIRVGFHNRYKVGQWTPVEITLRGGAKQVTGLVTLTVEDDDGTPSRVGAQASPADLCQLLPGADTTVRMFVKFGHADGELRAALHEPVRTGGKTVAGKLLAEKEFHAGLEADESHFLPGMAATQELFVTVGPASVGMKGAIALSGQTQADREAVAVHLEDPDKLPTRWYGYEGVDVVVLPARHPEVYRKLAPEGARASALDEWVRMGGRLLLMVGSQADEVLAKGAPLARFAPGRLEEIVTLRRTSALEAYAGGSSPVPGLGPGSSAALRVPRLAKVRGTVEVEEGNLPLVIRAPYGLGQVVFVAADLDRPPLSNWSDRGRLIDKLLGRSPVKTEEGAEGGSVMHHGYNDMAGKLRSQLERFRGVNMVPFWVVAALIFLYILLIGPGDYLLLRKVVRRMQWTWVTFPAIVLVTSAGAYALAWWLKGDQLRVSQVDLVDVDTAGGRVRGTTWLNFFSPGTESYDLSFRPMLCNGYEAEDADVLASWFGHPGEGLGGMRAGTSNRQLWSRGYDFTAGLRAMDGVPVQVWTTKSITARWHAPCQANPQAFPQANLADEDGLPKGTITNTFDFPLFDCILAYGRWGYDLGKLEPGQWAMIEPMSRQRVELNTLLSAAAPGESSRDRGRGGRSGDTAADTLRTMMFFETLGGSRRQGLSNRYQQFVDMSGLLKSGRAVLVATVPARTSGPQRHGAVLLRDGQPMAQPDDRHTVIYRFVFPVKKRP